jgi:exodeoxyribonuclease V gamma subunit
MLGELVEDFDARFIDPVAPPVGSTLHVLQRDILDRRPHLPPVETGRGIPPDSSIRILACAGIRREVEAIANEIWTAMKSRTGADRIRFHEIAIAIPDTARDAYIADIEAVFRRIHGIPIEIVSRYGAGASRVAEAFAMILDLPLGRFTRGQMLALMLHPSIARAAQAPDSATLARWLEEAGVFFQSASGDDGGAYAGGTFEWDQALARMAAGTAMRADFADASARVVDSAQRRLIPIEIAQDLSASAAWTIRTARGVIADAIAMRTASLALSDWSKLFEEIAATYIASADAGDDRARGELAEAIASIVPEGIQSAAVGFGVARALVLGRIGGLESRRGRLASTGVAVGTVTQLQSIPFKIIFVPAIGEGIFPVRDARDEIDLRRIARRAGDVWPAERDRYLFLQCLMAARESIVLSYVARDPASGDVREPSAIVSELRYILSGYLDANGVAALTIDHPASRYDLSYFPDLARAAGVDLKKTLTSYDAEAHHAARMSAIRADFVRACGIGALATDQNLIDVIDPAVAAKILPMTRTIADPPEIDQARERDRYDVTLSALRRFLECPAQGSARRALGMEDEDGDEIELEHEPFALDNLNHANILREAIAARAGISGVDSAYRAQLEIAQARGVAPAGIFAQAQTESDVTLMRQWIAAASSCGIADLSEWRRIRFGPGDEVATDARAFDRIELDAMVNGRAVKIAIHGQSELFSPELERSIKFVAHKDANAKDRLGMALGAIALAASGNAPAKEFNAIVIAGNEEKVSAKAIAFDLPDASSAREYLADLAGDMLSGLHDYFIPIDAIDSGHAEAEESVRAAFKLRAENARRSSNSHHHCSSDYGPLASVHELRPPDDARAQEIIESRFGPILAIFDRAERKRK